MNPYMKDLAVSINYFFNEQFGRPPTSTELVSLIAWSMSLFDGSVLPTLSPNNPGALTAGAPGDGGCESGSVTAPAGSKGPLNNVSSFATCVQSFDTPNEGVEAWMLWLKESGAGQDAMKLVSAGDLGPLAAWLMTNYTVVYTANLDVNPTTWEDLTEKLLYWARTFHAQQYQFPLAKKVARIGRAPDFYLNATAAGPIPYWRLAYWFDKLAPELIPGAKPSDPGFLVTLLAVIRMLTNNGFYDGRQTFNFWRHKSRKESEVYSVFALGFSGGPTDPWPSFSPSGMNPQVPQNDMPGPMTTAGPCPPEKYNDPRTGECLETYPFMRAGVADLILALNKDLPAAFIQALGSGDAGQLSAAIIETFFPAAKDRESWKYGTELLRKIGEQASQDLYKQPIPANALKLTAFEPEWAKQKSGTEPGDKEKKGKLPIPGQTDQAASTETAGMSMGTKVLIGAGVLAVGAIVVSSMGKKS